MISGILFDWKQISYDDENTFDMKARADNGGWVNRFPAACEWNLDQI